MEYQKKREIEEVFESYCKALETRDTALMEQVWKKSAADIIYSVYGIVQGSDIASQLIGVILPSRIKALRIGHFEMQVLMETDHLVMMQTKYEAAAELEKEAGTALRTLIETQRYEKSKEGWKLSYIHQSWKPEHPAESVENRMEQALCGMLEWMNKASGHSYPVPRSMNQRLHLLNERLQSWQSDPDEEYIQLQETFLQERRKLRDLQIIPNEKSAVPQIEMQEASLIAAEAVIGFMDANQNYDPLLSLDAGIELQRDIAMIQLMKPRDILVLDGYHLPVKKIIEVMANPVYGLFTVKKAREMEELFRQALLQAAKSGCKSIVIHAGWHQTLHLPLDFTKTMINILQELPADTFDAVIFQVSRSDERKALESALEGYPVEIQEQTPSDSKEDFLLPDHS